MDSSSTDVLHVMMGLPVCNNRCVFCIDRSAGAPEPLDMRVVEDLLERAAGKTRKVAFTAGEPTLSPLLLEAARAARRRGYAVIGLVTNGRRLQDPAFCARLLDAGVNEIRVSLHGPEAAVHDPIVRRRGAFRQTARGLENLAALRGASPPFYFEVICVLIKANLDRIRPMHDFVQRFAIDHLNFNVVEPLGNARDGFEAVMPRYERILEAAHRSGLDFRSSRVSLSRVPFCAGGYDWAQENALIAEADGLIGFDAGKGKTHGPPCRGCAARDRCPGIWSRYVEAYGWDEFTPVTPAARREGRAFRLVTGSACNNHCVHCVDGPAAAEPPTQPPISAALRRGFLQGYRRVEFAGGETLLDPRCEGWLREARDIGFSFVAIETNGRVLCLPKYLDLLVRSRPDEVIVRLNAGDAPAHDAMARVPGAFVQTVAAMRRLRSQGIPFSARVRRHGSNEGSLAAAEALASAEGARRIHVMGLAAHERPPTRRPDNTVP